MPSEQVRDSSVISDSTKFFSVGDQVFCHYGNARWVPIGGDNESDNNKTTSCVGDFKRAHAMSQHILGHGGRDDWRTRGNSRIK